MNGNSRQVVQPQRRDVALEVQDVAREPRVGLLEHALLERIEALRELVDLGPVVVHDDVDDPVHQRGGPLAERHRIARADLRHLLDGPRLVRVDRDEVVRPEEEIDVVRLETVLGSLEVDAVQDDVEEGAVRFDLRMVGRAEGVFHRQLVEVEDVRQDAPFTGARVEHVDPEMNAAARLEPRRIHVVRRSRRAAGVDVDLDQSPTLTCSAACAAASRATGMRYGEALT